MSKYEWDIACRIITKSQFLIIGSSADSGLFVYLGKNSLIYYETSKL